MKPLLAKFRGRSLAEFWVRGLQSVRAHAEWLQMIAVGPEVVRHPVRPAEFRQDRSFASLLSTADVGAIAQAVAHNDPDTASKMYEQSLALQRGFVSLLGHGFVSIGNPPRWHAEPLVGRQVIKRHWSRIDHLDAAVVVDHKLLWELNRTQYLFAPAFCWLHDRDPRQFDLIQSHLDSWLADNPPGFGINWSSSLEVAYRAIAWCWLLWMLRGGPWKTELHARLTASLQAHALHIERYLSTYYSPNTHLTGEALGLFYVGSALPSARRASVWRNKGSEILERCLERQVHPDGVYFEQATQYHRYTTEIYLHYKLLADSTDWKVSDRVPEFLGHLFDVLRTLTCGNGRMPLIGDDDGGALLPLDLRSPDDLRALLLLGAVALNRPDLVIDSKPSPTLAYWLCGIDKTDQVIRLPAVKPAWRDIYFARGGVAVLRDGWVGDSAVAVINAGPHGALTCAHGHADALAMTLTLGSDELFIERGTLSYTGPERNEFRSTESHNTLEIDHESSAVPGGPFRWLTIPPPAYGTIYTTPAFTGFEGVANGHGNGSGISTHQRTVLHRRGGAWVILDRGTKAGARGGVVRWQLSPQLNAERIGPCAVSISSQAGLAIATVFAPLSRALNLRTREVSSRLGHRALAQVLELEVDVTLEALTIVVPALPTDIVMALTMTDDAGLRCCAWADTNGKHRVLVSSPGVRRLQAAGVRVDCNLSWWIERSVLKQRQESASVLFAAMGVRYMEMAGVEQRLNGAGAAAGGMIVLAATDGHWKRTTVDEPNRGKE